ncbi:hypothetical protein ACHAQJ_005577 [Trichoderma viride]
MPEFKDYTIGWIISEIAEFMAAQQFFDIKHKQEDWLDNSHYALGSIGEHNVVLVYGLPRIGISDVVAFAATSADMLRTFPNIKLCVIGGAGFTEDFKASSVGLGDIAMGTATVDANYLSFKSSIPEKNREIARALITASDSFKSNFNASVEEIIIKHIPAESPFLACGCLRPSIVSTAIRYIGGDVYSDLTLEEKVDLCCSGMEVNSKVPCIKVMGMRGHSIVDEVVTGWEGFAAMISAAFIHGILLELASQS